MRHMWPSRPSHPHCWLLSRKQAPWGGAFCLPSGCSLLVAGCREPRLAWEHWTCRGAAARRLWSPPVLFHLCQGPAVAAGTSPLPAHSPPFSGAQVGRFERPRAGRSLWASAVWLPFGKSAACPRHLPELPGVGRGGQERGLGMGLARPCTPDPRTAADSRGSPGSPGAPEQQGLVGTCHRTEAVCPATESLSRDFHPGRTSDP